MRQRGRGLVLAAMLVLGAVPAADRLGLGPTPARAASSEAASTEAAAPKTAPKTAQADPGEGRKGREGMREDEGKDHGTDHGGGHGQGQGAGFEDIGDDAAPGDGFGIGGDADPDGSWDGSVSDDYITVDDDASIQDGALPGSVDGPTEVDPGFIDPDVGAPITPDGDVMGRAGTGSGTSAPVAQPSGGLSTSGGTGSAPAVPDAPAPTGPASGAPGFAPAAAPPAAGGAVRAARPEGRAQPSLVLVELFTSQGCTACPPAESLLGELARQPGVLALSLHVDYWDYLGWKDDFAQARFTSRQRAYARRDGARSVFTPQLVIGGVAGASAPRPAQVAREIDRQVGAQPVTARVAEANGRERVTLSAPRGFAGSADIIVVRALPKVDVQIRGGENIGRSVSHINVVRDWDVVAEWDGKAPIVLDIATTAARRRGELVAVIVQERLPGPGGRALPGAALGAIRLD